MKNSHKVLICTLAFSQPLFADDDWFVRPVAGLSQMSDLSSSASNIDGVSGQSDISVDSGFNLGLGVGYNYTDNFAVELFWEYRTNDSSTVVADTVTYNDGNYASNIFALNGIYNFDSQGDWTPYVGAGFTWVQEVDIDLEDSGMERSLSADGDTGYQLFVGTNYKLNEDWDAQFELRYGSITGIDLAGEGNTDTMTDLDYQTTTLQFGLSYRF